MLAMNSALNADVWRICGGAMKMADTTIDQRSHALHPMPKRSIVRPVVIYGPEAKANIRLLIRLASLPLPLPFAAFGNRRSILAIDNLVSAILFALDHPAKPIVPVIPPPVAAARLRSLVTPRKCLSRPNLLPSSRADGRADLSGCSSRRS